jgi:hypothetical protein
MCGILRFRLESLMLEVYNPGPPAYKEPRSIVVLMFIGDLFPLSRDVGALTNMSSRVDLLWCPK